MLTWFNFRKTHFAGFFRNDDGQVMVEYVMLLVLVSLGVFISSPPMADAVRDVMGNTSSLLKEGLSF